MINFDWIKTTPIAHRGLHDSTHPENTLASVKKAIQHNYAIEIDVKMLNDGTLIIMHDATLERLTNKTGSVYDLTKEELKDTKILGTDEYIPTLREVLDCVKGQVPLLLDIKSEKVLDHSLEQKIYEEIKSYIGNIAIMAFNPATVRWFQKHAPNIPRGLLGTIWKGNLPEMPKSSAVKFVLGHNLFAWICKPQFYAYNIQQIPSFHSKKYKKLPKLAWVTTSQALYQEKAKYIDNIIFENFLP